MTSPSLTVSSLFPGSAAKSYITRACWEWKGKEVTNVNLVKKEPPSTSLYHAGTNRYNSGCGCFGRKETYHQSDSPASSGEEPQAAVGVPVLFWKRGVLVAACTALRDCPPKSSKYTHFIKGKKGVPPLSRS